VDKESKEDYLSGLQLVRQHNSSLQSTEKCSIYFSCLSQNKKRAINGINTTKYGIAGDSIQEYNLNFMDFSWISWNAKLL
jgi:hypothetical protein